MKNIKRLLCIISVIAVVFSLAACNNGKTVPDEETETQPEEREIINVVSATGAPGLAIMKVATDRSYAYKVEYLSSSDEISARIKNGEAKIAALPLNTALNLYNETNGGIKILAVNSLGSLQILSKNEKIKSIGDLKGKTIYASGKGSFYETILNYILSENDMVPGENITIEFKDSHSALVDFAAEDGADICVVPEPYASAICVKNDKFTHSIDVASVWAKAAGSPLAQFCVVADSEFAENNPELIDEFLTFDEVSVNYTAASSKAPYEAASAGFIESEEIAAMTIPFCHLKYIDGEQMKAIISKSFEILCDFAPDSFPGIPDENIYYIK